MKDELTVLERLYKRALEYNALLQRRSQAVIDAETAAKAGMQRERTEIINAATRAGVDIARLELSP